LTANSSSDPSAPLPDWALGQAMNDLEDQVMADRDERARELVQEFEDERHEEDDDPDQGGEGSPTHLSGPGPERGRSSSSRKRDRRAVGATECARKLSAARTG